MVPSKELTALFEDFKKELRAELKDVKETFDRELRKELREIKASLNFMNKVFEEISAENKDLKAANAKLEEKCDALERQVKAHEERITEVEQYSRNRNIEITGVPVKPKENLTEIIVKIGEKVGVSVVPADLESVHRVTTANQPQNKNIVVQFARRQLRDSLLEEARNKRLSCSDLGFGTQAPVFVNEHLCPELKRLMGQAAACKREAQWKYLWVRNGKIFARQADRIPAIRIARTDDLDKIRASS